MGLIDFQSFPMWINLAVFAAAAAAVWAAGTRLARFADAISERTGLGQAFIGMLLLGGITSLPEVATTLSASALGNAPLAVNNILGGIAMQVAILAIADAVVRDRALTRVAGEPVLLLQGILLVAALSIVGTGVTVGDYAVAGVGVWSAAVAVFVVVGLYLIKSYEASPRWEPTGRADDGDAPSKREAPTEETTAPEARRRRERVSNLRTGRLVLYTTLAGLAILAAGFVVARTGDALAEQTGLGASFVGAVAVAIATSLPEVSTTVAAMRIGQHRLAFSNIFGTNLFDAGILFLADAVYREGAVLNEVGAFSQAATLLGILLTTLYLAGIVERSDRTAFDIGYDSLLVLIVYAGGVFLLYTLR